ncbi:MAG TPA: hypothetical protein VLM40_17245 [Gemmata sp.]|nr:hypothetical protein [Gemmata sp.]
MRASAILAAILAASLAAADDKDKPTVKEIPTKGLKITFPKMGKATEPTKIKSLEELKKNAVVGAAAEEIAKQIDFEKQDLLVFAWSGSGQDKITASIGASSDGKPIVYAEYLPGKTRDLRKHVRLFAATKGLKVEVEIGRQ